MVGLSPVKLHFLQENVFMLLWTMVISKIFFLFVFNSTHKILQLLDQAVDFVVVMGKGK